jgi:hypothetical protein
MLTTTLASLRSGRLTLACRFAAVSVLVAVYFVSDWTPLRRLHRDSIAWALQCRGFMTTRCIYDGSPAIRVGERVYPFKPECTNIHLLLLVLPFLWMPRVSILGNLLRVGIVSILIVCGNLLRCGCALLGNLEGWLWLYSHDIPYHILWSFVLVVCVVPAIRRDIGNLRPAADGHRSMAARTTG